MQEINISLESPREEEKGHTPERKANEIHKTSAGRHEPLVLEEQNQEEMSQEEGVGSEFERGESMEESEEEKKESDQEEKTPVNNQPSTVNHNLQLMSPAITQVPPVSNPIHQQLGT